MNVSEIIDFFIPHPDIRKRHSIIIDAPAELVYKTACNFDLESIPLVHFIFRLREIFMASKKSSPDIQKKITPLALLNNGWGELAEKEARYLIAGAACQPWKADVIFKSIPADQFKAFSEPAQVKIVWSFETEALGTDRTKLSTETRVVATDDEARIKFRRYWLTVRIGIIAIRWMLLSEIRRKAENISRKKRDKPVRINSKKEADNSQLSKQVDGR